LKPKHTTSRLFTMLYKRASDDLDKTTNHMDLIEIMQGFRNKKNKDMYMKIRQVLISKKEKLFPL
jgi:hypothetical protein